MHSGQYEEKTGVEAKKGSDRGQMGPKEKEGERGAGEEVSASV
jgi:hypothetical protein